MMRNDWRTISPALASFRRPPTAVIAEWQRMRLPMPEESTMGTFSRFTTRSRTPLARASLHLARNSSRLSPRASLPSTSRTAVVPCVFRRVDIAVHDTPFPAICESRRAEGALFSIASEPKLIVSPRAAQQNQAATPPPLVCARQRLTQLLPRPANESNMAVKVSAWQLRTTLARDYNGKTCLTRSI